MIQIIEVEKTDTETSFNHEENSFNEDKSRWKPERISTGQEGAVERNTVLVATLKDLDNRNGTKWIKMYSHIARFFIIFAPVCVKHETYRHSTTLPRHFPIIAENNINVRLAGFKWKHSIYESLCCDLKVNLNALVPHVPHKVVVKSRFVELSKQLNSKFWKYLFHVEIKKKMTVLVKIVHFLCW